MKTNKHINLHNSSKPYSPNLRKFSTLGNNSVFSQASLYNTRVQNIFILGRTESFSLSGLKYFISALLQIYSIDMRKGMIINSFINLLILYIAFFSCMNTSFVSFAVQSQKHFLFPKFLIDVIDKISLYVRNTSRFTSLTECVFIGPKYTDLKIYFNSLIQEKDMSSLKCILNETKFSSISADSHLLEELVSRIENKVLPLLNKETENDFFSEISDLIPLCVNETFSGSSHQMQLFNTKFKLTTTPHLGIFRFKNSPLRGEYFVSADGMSRLEPSLRDYFCSILIIVNPVFQIGRDKDNLHFSTSIREGDLPIDINGINQSLAWSYLFSDIFTNSGGSSRIPNRNSETNYSTKQHPGVSSTKAKTRSNRARFPRSTPNTSNYQSMADHLNSVTDNQFITSNVGEDGKPNASLFERAILNCLFKHFLNELRLLEKQQL
jgi:hypothetical protein